MYVLLTINNDDPNRSVYSRRILGAWYELEFFHDKVVTGVAAKVKYKDGSDFPEISIACDDEAYITLLNNETIHVVCRGKNRRKAS